MQRIAAFLAPLVALIACGQPQQTSKTAVVNGTMAFYFEHPNVVSLYNAHEDALCTGTFVSETQLITAAHCTEGYEADENGLVDGELSILYIDDLAKGIATVHATSTKIVRNPMWEYMGSNVNKYDLAVVTFPRGVMAVTSKISNRSARIGDVVELFGFGLDQDEDSSNVSSAAVFRKGFNVIDDIAEGFIGFAGESYTSSGDGDNASAGSGDSGGPLFINDEIVGIVSGGQPPVYEGDETYNLYIDIHSPESEAFLAEHLGQ